MTTLGLSVPYSWDAIRDAYTTLVTHYIPGPLSLSYFVPFILLPTALLIPPSRLSHLQICHVFLPPIYASVFHAWYSMGGVDVISVDGLLWSTLLIGFKDVRKDFRRLVLTDVLPSDDKCQSGPPTEKHVNDSSHPSSADNGFTPILKQDNASKPHEQPANSNVTTQGHILGQTFPKSLYDRLIWVLTLLSSTRMFSWDTGSPVHLRQQIPVLRNPPTRMRFALSLIPTIIFTQALLPLLLQLALHDPVITSKKPPSSQSTLFRPLFPFPVQSADPPTTVILLQTYIPAVILRPMTLGLWTFCALTTGFALPAPLVVFSNWLIGLPSDAWSPHVLPEYFGSFSTVLDHGVGGIWGRWWHQHMRVMSSAPGAWIADKLGLIEEGVSERVDANSEVEREGGKCGGGTRWSRQVNKECRYLLVLTSAFFFSGVTHMGLVPPAVCGAWGLRMRIAGFFWLQAFAIGFERAVRLGWTSHARSSLDIAGKTEDTPRDVQSGTSVQLIMRAVRFIWVIAWLCLTIPLLYRPYDQLGWWKLYPPVDVGGRVGWFMRGDWIP